MEVCHATKAYVLSFSEALHAELASVDPVAAKRIPPKRCATASSR